MALDRFKLELLKAEFKSALDAYEREFERACRAKPARGAPSASAGAARRAVEERRRLLDIRKTEIESMRSEFEGLERGWAPTVEPPSAAFPDRWQEDLSVRQDELDRRRAAVEDRWRRLEKRAPKPASEASEAPNPVPARPAPPPKEIPTKPFVFHSIEPPPVEDPFPQPTGFSPVEEPPAPSEPVPAAPPLPTAPPPPPPPPEPVPEPVREVAAAPLAPSSWESEGMEELKDWPAMPGSAEPKPVVPAPAPPPAAEAEKAPTSEAPSDEESLDFHRAELEKALQKLREAQKGLGPRRTDDL